MVAERYKKHLFLTALVLAILVFLSGILLGYSLDKLRVNDIVSLVKQNELNMESYILEQDFLDAIGGESCGLLEPRFKDLSESLANIGNTLTSYEKSKLFKKADYDYLKAKYFNLEIQAYLLALKLKKQCNLTKVNILYFYKQGDMVSLRQGFILDSLVNKYGIEKLSIYSFDKFFENVPLIEMVEKHYNITVAPSLIINNKLRVSGLIGEEELEEIIREELEIWD